ncbi:DUF1553 domain-containing protein [bacterium]|nr:DUF1553 domain-containing protein [bacterium]
MRGSRFLQLAVALVLSVSACVADRAAAGNIANAAPDSAPMVTPQRVALSGPGSRWQLLVERSLPNGLTADLTRDVTCESLDSNIVAVSPDGVVRGLADGETQIRITIRGTGVAASATLNVPVTVSDSNGPRSLHFENDILPIFARFGCNTSGCHGKAEGQNGFKLSIFGFDPDADLAALVQEGRGRRISFTRPDQSLLLLKASGGAPHGGGIRIRRNSGEYRLLRDWIVAGAPAGAADAPKVVSLRVTPSERRLAMDAQQQLQVTAIYSSGREVDVTHHAKFQSNNDSLVQVDEYGLVRTSKTPGEAAVMASYQGAVDTFRAMVPQPDDGTEFPSRPVFNFIDELVDARLRKLNIHPSELCSDADFLRRAYLDIIGTLPTADEARTFLASNDPQRRNRLVDELLQRPEYADLQALKWSDVLRVDRLALGHKAAYSYYHWIRDSFAQNRPFDEFTREVVTAAGPLSDHPAGYLYKVTKTPGTAASTLSQVFLGVRLECAQCHHHPFDQWSQRDYAGMQAYFSQVGFKTTKSGEFLTATKGGATKHPRSGDVVEAHALLQPEPETTPDGDRRELFAQWLTAKDNRWFARNIVNRVWAHLLGRGIVEPVDDVRLTNPPTNPALLDALAEHFVASGYDLHDLIRTITASRTYQLSSHPNASNDRDEQNYSRALFRRLDAEVRFDMICQVTGMPEKFDGLPAGYRAIQLWDSQVKHYFLGLFGRPIRSTACECERAAEPSVGQVLHIINSPEIQAKLSDSGGRLARLVNETADNPQLVEKLYLSFYSRFPTDEERAAVTVYLAQAADRQRAVEDVAWTLMNTVEFLFNH